MRHVIIGNGPAGVIAADTLRKLDAGCQITLIGDEPEPPYSRMAIPYFLIDHIDERGTYLRKTSGHFELNKIELVRGHVERINTERKTLTLAGGTELGYDKLLVATGSHPVAPPIPGMDLPGVRACWTLEDAREIVRRARPGAKVVLIGAGFIAATILEALASCGPDLTIIETQDRMVPRMMNATAGGLIKQWCEQQGVHVLTSTQVQAVEPGQGQQPLRVVLDNGRALPADLVITATGVKANVGFLHGSGVNIEEGVLVDNRMQSNVADIYAAGDVAQGLDFSTGGYSVQAIQPTAADHGQVAASNMAGQPRTHRGSINMNVLATLGLISSSFGLWNGVDGGESVELCDAGRFHYVNLQFDDDCLVGASSLGLTEHVGVIRGLIQTKVRLGEWKQRLMQDPTRLMEAYVARTQSLGYNARVV